VSGLSEPAEVLGESVVGESVDGESVMALTLL